MGRKAGVESYAGRQHAKAIGADDAQLRPCSQSLQLCAQRIGAVAGRVRGDDNGDGGAQACGFLCERHHMLARRGDYDDVWRLAQVAEGRHADLAFDLAMARVDEMNGALESAIAQIVQHRPPKAPRSCARTNKRNGARVKQAVEVANAHDGGLINPINSRYAISGSGDVLFFERL